MQSWILTSRNVTLFIPYSQCEAVWLGLSETEILKFRAQKLWSKNVGLLFVSTVLINSKYTIASWKRSIYYKVRLKSHTSFNTPVKTSVSEDSHRNCLPSIHQCNERSIIWCRLRNSETWTYEEKQLLHSVPYYIFLKIWCIQIQA